MLLTFLGAISSGVLAACVAYVARRQFGVNLRWLVPAAAGAAMFGFTVWNDYTWFGRTAEALPGDVVVTWSGGSPSPLKPWEHLAPVTSRFAAVDLATRVRNDFDPSMVRARVYLVARYQPVFESDQIFDCERSRRADAVGLDDRGLPAEGAWVAAGEEDATLAAVCGA